MAVGNPVLFVNGSSEWTLGEVCVAVGIVLAVTCVAVLPFVVRLLKLSSRRLDAQEASTLAMTGHESSYVKPEAVVHGPAAGVEWRFSMTIGDLRSAWQQRRFGYFYAMPAYCMSVPTALTLIFEGIFLNHNSKTMLLMIAAAPFVFLGGMTLFMMWAAVYTKLE